MPKLYPISARWSDCVVTTLFWTRMHGIWRIHAIWCTQCRFWIRYGLIMWRCGAVVLLFSLFIDVLCARSTDAIPLLRLPSSMLLSRFFCQNQMHSLTLYYYLQIKRIYAYSLSLNRKWELRVGWRRTHCELPIWTFLSLVKRVYACQYGVLVSH